MSLRLEMLQVARLSSRQLGDARDLVQHFLLDQRHPDGGFQDRAGDCDIYYTVFGLEGLIAVQTDLPVEQTAAYLRRFGAGERLDLVHLACLARAWAAIARGKTASPPQPPSPPSELVKEGAGRVRADERERGDSDDVEHSPVLAMSLSDDDREAMAARLETFRSADGGYNPVPGSPHGTIYAAFMALGAYQDLQRDLPDPERLLASVMTMRSGDGGFGNFPESDIGLTTTTAAAVGIHRQLGQPMQGDVGSWLLSRYHAQGGFAASPMTPMPDLLSTATALHALATLHVPLAPIQESCLDFIDTLWTNRGGFYGSWADDCVDCEYTFYGLLALGHLTL